MKIFGDDPNGALAHGGDLMQRDRFPQKNGERTLERCVSLCFVEIEVR